MFFFRRSPKEENKKRLQKFSVRFLAFSFIIKKSTNTYYCRNRCKGTSHYMGIFDINVRGEDLLAHCVNADLNFCNVDNKPTFRTKTREEVLDFTFVNRCACDRIVGWHVSNVLSFSDHIYIRFQVKSRIQSQAKMFRNARRSCWNKYVNELE